MIKKYTPDKTLNNIIDYIWVVEKNNLSNEEKVDHIMPLGHINIIFNFKDDYYNIEDKEFIIPNIALIGQIKKIKKVKYGNNLSQIGISLKPLGFLLLYNIYPYEFTEKVINAIKIDKSLISTYNNLKNVDSIDEKIRIIIDYLYKKIPLKNENNNDFNRLIFYIKKSKGEVSVKELVNYFNYSQSTLERMFKKFLGLTPKEYINIIKFYSNFSDESVYYDQSHFIKNCKKYTGKTPSELNKYINELTLNYIINDDFLQYKD